MPGLLHVTKRPTRSTRGYFSYAVRSVDYLETVRRRLVRLYERAKNRTPEREEYRRQLAQEQRQRTTGSPAGAATPGGDARENRREYRRNDIRADDVP